MHRALFVKRLGTEMFIFIHSAGIIASMMSVQSCACSGLTFYK